MRFRRKRAGDVLSPASDRHIEGSFGIIYPSVIVAVKEELKECTPEQATHKLLLAQELFPDLQQIFASMMTAYGKLLPDAGENTMQETRKNDDDSA